MSRLLPHSSGHRILASPATFFTRLSSCFVGLLLCLALTHCKKADPLETVRQLQLAGNYAATVEPLRELLSERPDDPEVNFLYGQALLLTGQPSLATWALRQAMQDPDWLLPAGMKLAEGALLTRDFNEVVEVTTAIHEAHPENAMALLYRAQAHAHWRKDPEAALADANRVLEMAPERIEAYEPRILALLALDRHEEASEQLAEAGRRMREVADMPPDRIAWHCSTTATFAEEGGDEERARETWLECLEAHPSDSTVVTNAVKFYDKRGEWERSIEVLRASNTEGRYQRIYRIMLADRLRVVGEVAEAEALLRDATKEEDPRRAASAWLDLANFRNAMGEHDVAADALGRAIERLREVEEPPAQLFFHHADALLAAGQLEQALRAAEEIPSPAQRQLIRARVAQERGDAARALALYDESLRLWPDNPWARYYAALAAEAAGDFDRALEEYRYSVRISVDATDARTRAAQLLIAENQALLAYQLLFLEVDRAPLDPEGELLSYYLMGRVANPKQLQTSLIELGQKDPLKLPAALARGAEGVARAVGPKGALQLLVGAPGVDYSNPYAAPALRTLVRFAHAAGEPEKAGAALATALAAHPESSTFHELHGLHLELSSGDPDEIRAAYERALRVGVDSAGALSGLARLALPHDPATAFALFDRAAAADPEDAAPKLAAARALITIGRVEQAARRLDALLEQHPFEAAAAAELVTLDLERDRVTPRTLERALRAVRFGGGADAFDLLARVHREREEPELADRAAKRAQAIRDALSSRG